MSRGSWTILAGLLVAAPEVCRGATLRVPSEYPTIQAGVDAAVVGDSVLVAPGTYTDVTVRILAGTAWAAVIHMRAGVLVISESGAEVTILDMQGAAPPAQGANVVGGDGTIVGFTITGAPYGHPGLSAGGGGEIVVHGCVFRDLDAGITSAGGVFTGNGTYTELVDCRFERCRAQGAGAVWISASDCYISRCTFEDCERTAVQVIGDLPNGFRAVVEDCTFRRNRDPSGNGGGFAISQYGGGCELRRCVFEENESRGVGGGASLGDPFDLVEDCVFRGNRSLNSTGGALMMDGPGEVRGCTFWENGAVSYSWANAVTFQGTPSVFAHNVLGRSLTGGAAVSAVPGVVLTGGCNVFWNNPGGHAQNYAFAPTDRIADPLFCDEAAGDLTLQPLSPCLPEFSLGCGLIGALEQGCGTISVKTESWGKVKGAYRGGPGGLR